MKSSVNEAMLRDMLDSESFDYYTKDYELKKVKKEIYLIPILRIKAQLFL